jgi:hypothetical protein
MTKYRFETSDEIREVDVSATTESHLIDVIIKSLFGTDEPPFSLKLQSKITDCPVVVRRIYRQNFEQDAQPVASAPKRKKMKRRWRSPEPLLDIVRRRRQASYSNGYYNPM